MALYKVPLQNDVQYTLSAQASAGTNTLVLNQDVSAIVQSPGVCVVDRVDSNGNKTPSAREFFTFTGVSTTNLTGVVGGLAGSSQQVHQVGAIVEFIPDVLWAQQIYNAITLEQTTSGAHVSLGSLGYVRTASLVVNSSASLADVYGTTLALTSLASIPVLNIGTYLNASGASLSGIPLSPIFVVLGGISGPSTSLLPHIPMPRVGNWRYANVVTNTVASGASAVFDILKNGTSIFSTTTRPWIAGGGTFFSGASISTVAFNEGDLFTVDYKTTGGYITNFTISLRSN